MHSSRIAILGVSAWGRDVCLGCCLPGGGVCPGEVSAQGVCAWGVLP